MRQPDSIVPPCFVRILHIVRRVKLDAIQVRDKIASSLLGRAAAAILGLPFIY